MAADRREDTERDADGDRQQARHVGQFQGRRRAFHDDVENRPPLLVAGSEIALHGALEEPQILHEERPVEAEFAAKHFDVGGAALLAQHVVDRVADKPEHGERHQPDDEQDDDRLQDAA